MSVETQNLLQGDKGSTELKQATLLPAKLSAQRPSLECGGGLGDSSLNAQRPHFISGSHELFALEMWVHGLICHHPPVAQPETLPYLAKAALPNGSQNLEVVEVHCGMKQRYKQVR